MMISRLGVRLPLGRSRRVVVSKEETRSTKTSSIITTATARQYVGYEHVWNVSRRCWGWYSFSLTILYLMSMYTLIKYFDHLSCEWDS